MVSNFVGRESERQYLELLGRVLDFGVEKTDRTGTGTKSVFGHQMRFDLRKGFPLLTTKKVYFKGLAYELLWFLSGNTNVKYLQENDVHIWDDWADENGNLGPVYGKQWVNWEGKERTINQIEEVVKSIKANPDSRRHIVSAWNPAEVPDMALPPCHMFFQFYVAGEKLSCQIYIRSNDLFLGAPFNIAEYALLTHMVAQQCDLEVGELIYTIGDAHIYTNHIDQVKEQLQRKPKALPKFYFSRKPDSIFDYQYEDFIIVGYDPYPAIKAPVAV